MPNCKTVAICNQKGGTGKTTTTVNLGVGLASGEWCWGTSFYHTRSHYGFLFLMCPTLFYNRPKNTDRENRFLEGYVANPIYDDVVYHLFNMIRDYLSTDWGGKIADGLQRGYLM